MKERGIKEISKDIEKYHNPRLRKKIEITGIILSMSIVLLMIVSLLFYGFYRERLTENIYRYGEIGLFFSTFFLELIPQMLSSHFPFVISILSGINILDAILVAVFASLLSTVLAFELGRKFGWEFVCSLAKPSKIIKIINFWAKYGKWFVFVSAFTPLPYFPLVFGALRMPRKQMLLFGIVPRVISFVALGYLISLGKLV